MLDYDDAWNAAEEDAKANKLDEWAGRMQHNDVVIAYIDHVPHVLRVSRCSACGKTRLINVNNICYRCELKYLRGE